MTLTEFLLARIDEDGSRYGTPYTRDGQIYPNAHLEGCDAVREHRPYPCDCGLTTHLLAECAAKRAIVEWLSGRQQIYVPTCSSDRSSPKSEEFVPGALMANPVEFHTLRYLAAVYADHPDYDEAWRP